MTMKDEAERLVIVDAFGCGGAAIQRPGARYAVQATPDQAARDDAARAAAAKDAAAKDAKDPRDRLHDAEESLRWRDLDRAVPVKSATGDAVQDAYRDRDEADANAWRSPR